MKSFSQYIADYRAAQKSREKSKQPFTGYGAAFAERHPKIQKNMKELFPLNPFNADPNIIKTLAPPIITAQHVSDKAVSKTDALRLKVAEDRARDLFRTAFQVENIGEDSVLRMVQLSDMTRADAAKILKKKHRESQSENER